MPCPLRTCHESRNPPTRQLSSLSLALLLPYSPTNFMNLLLTSLDSTMFRDDTMTAEEQIPVLEAMVSSEDLNGPVKSYSRRHTERSIKWLQLSNAALICVSLLLSIYVILTTSIGLTSKCQSRVTDTYCEAHRFFSYCVAREFSSSLPMCVENILISHSIPAPANEVVEYEYRRIVNDTRFLGPPQDEWHELMRDLTSGKFHTKLDRCE